MNKIILHWTAGSHFPCSQDLNSYHFLIDKYGKIYNGFFSPEDNENCLDNRYAKHCGGGNTGAIGIALCAMAGFNPKTKYTNYPITKIQCETLFNLSAELSLKYNIPISPLNIMTHYEFGLLHPNTPSHGKIDITYLHPFPKIAQNQMGNFIRNKIFWYFLKKNKNF